MGFLGDLTGVNASIFNGAPGAEARIDQQNAEGGVDGYKLKLVTASTDSTEAGALTGANALISKHVFGIGVSSAFTTLADTAINQAGLPEIGYSLDTRYGNAPFSNLFEETPPTSVNGVDPVNTSTLQFFKDQGVTKWADLTWGGIPSIAAMAKDFATVSPTLGLSVCLLDTSIPIGTVDFTSVDLQLEQNHCNGSNGSWDISSSIGFQQSLRNAGLASKVVDIQPSAYASSTASSPTAIAAGEGGYYNGQWNFTTPTAGTQAMLATLHTYAPSVCPQAKGCIPDVGVTSGWLSMDQFIYGLQHLGNNPTSASFTNYFRTNKVDYTANGLLAQPLNWTDFGTLKGVPATQCQYVFKLTTTGFVPFNTKTDGLVCGPTVFVKGSKIVTP